MICGKDIILMEVVKHILNKNGISLNQYIPITSEEISIMEKHQRDVLKTRDRPNDSFKAHGSGNFTWWTFIKATGTLLSPIDNRYRTDWIRWIRWPE